MSLPAGVLNQSYAQDMAVVRTRTHWVWLGLLMVVLLVLPQVASDYLLSVTILICIWIIAALGLNLLLGYCGQISVAQSAFMAVGAYGTAILETKLSAPFWLAVPGGVLIAGLVGLIFAIPSLRIKGLYLALVTIAAQVIIVWVILHWQNVTGGPLGIRLPVAKVGPLAFDQPRSFYYLVLICLVPATYFAFCLTRFKVGRAFMAIRDNEPAAHALGIHVFGYKLLAFFIGCGYAGLAGALYVHHIGVANPDSYTLWQSIALLGMVVIGGMGTISGTVFGVVFFQGLQELTYNLISWLTAVAPAFAQGAGAGLPLLVFGLVIVMCLIFEPRGLAHRWQKIKHYYRIWPFAWQD